VKLPIEWFSLPTMGEKSKEQSSSQPDKKVAEEERPKPSQAEGDLKTVEEDLELKKAKEDTAPEKRQSS
jgi:hypothetical protein